MLFSPEFVQQIKHLRILVRQVSSGGRRADHRSRDLGGGMEFRDFRSYVPGDDLRHLDWVAFGRTDRYYIKQYEQETNLRAYVLLDISASMNYRYEAPVTKLTPMGDPPWAATLPHRPGRLRRWHPGPSAAPRSRAGSPARYRGSASLRTRRGRRDR